MNYTDFQNLPARTKESFWLQREILSKLQPRAIGQLVTVRGLLGSTKVSPRVGFCSAFSVLAQAPPNLKEAWKAEPETIFTVQNPELHSYALISCRYIMKAFVPQTGLYDMGLNNSKTSLHTLESHRMQKLLNLRSWEPQKRGDKWCNPRLRPASGSSLERWCS